MKIKSQIDAVEQARALATIAACTPMDDPDRPALMAESVMWSALAIAESGSRVTVAELTPAGEVSSHDCSWP